VRATWPAEEASVPGLHPWSAAVGVGAGKRQVLVPPLVTLVASWAGRLTCCRRCCRRFRPHRDRSDRVGPHGEGQVLRLSAPAVPGIETLRSGIQQSALGAAQGEGGAAGGAGQLITRSVVSPGRL